MIDMIVSLMRLNINVAIVTAAGYPGQPERFEQRVSGLLQASGRGNGPASTPLHASWRAVAWLCPFGVPQLVLGP